MTIKCVPQMAGMKTTVTLGLVLSIVFSGAAAQSKEFLIQISLVDLRGILFDPQL